MSIFGSNFQSLSKALTGEKAGEIVADEKAILDVLQELAQAKADLFGREIAQMIERAGTEDNMAVPVEAILAIKSDTYAMKSVDANAIKTAVQAIVDKIAPEDSGAKSGRADKGAGGLVVQMVGNVVQGILGSGEGFHQGKKRYVVFTEGLAVVRLDVHVWRQKIQNLRLKVNFAEEIVSIVLLKSAVDITKMRINTFIAIYQNQIAQIENLSMEEKLRHLAAARKAFNPFQN